MSAVATACNCNGSCRLTGRCGGVGPYPPAGTGGLPWWHDGWPPPFGTPIELAPEKPHGCICPPTAEKTCQGPMCPRRPITAAG